MSAADLLRDAVEAAPALRVEQDADGYLTIWDADDRAVLHQRYLDTGSHETDLAVVRLLGLLLAAAPHLANLLDADDDHDDEPCPARDRLRPLMRAIEERAS